jgi:hypothetical protein
MMGLWPATVADVELDGSASNLISLNITWAFDFVQDA